MPRSGHSRFAYNWRQADKITPYMKLRFLPFKNRPSSRNIPTHKVQILSPKGSYPRKSLLSEHGSLVIGEGLCFSVVPVSAKIEAGENYYSEVEWASLAEIRLYASALLSTDRECSYFSVYPVGRAYWIKTDAHLSDKRLLRGIRQELIRLSRAETPWSTPERPLYTLQQDAREIAVPPVFGGPQYQLYPHPVRFKEQRKLIDSIDTDDYLLMRGLSSLLRCGMLICHYQFIEEATNTLFISLEASFRLIIRQLESLGMKNVSSKDAAELIGRVFNEEPLEKYFEGDYENRIMTMHPESRYGTFPHAPLFVDDCYDLRDSLIEVYAYLITGYVDAKHKNKRLN
jgi:hypothetical protein